MLKTARYWLGVGCVTLSMTAGVWAEEESTASDAFDQDTQQEETGSDNDPFESVNRVVFQFNDFLDTWILKPTAQGYTYVAPEPVEIMVSNFFSNLNEPRNVINSLLQLEFGEALTATGRFLINSTIGIFGVVDVGTGMGLEYKHNDFGMTLAEWSVPAGPYVVLPVFGPNTIRSTVGLVPDMYTNPVYYVTPEKDMLLLTAADLVQLRAELLKQEGLIVGDKYTFIRDAYLQRREFLQSGGVTPPDEF